MYTELMLRLQNPSEKYIKRNYMASVHYSLWYLFRVKSDTHYFADHNYILRIIDFVYLSTCRLLLSYVWYYYDMFWLYKVTII
jgi:hypothetical protein